MSSVQSTFLTFMEAKEFIRTHVFPLVAGGFPSTFLSLELASPASTLIGKERSGKPAAGINNNKECLGGKTGNMITVWPPLSFLRGHTASRWHSLTGNIYCQTLILKFKANHFHPYLYPRGQEAGLKQP